MFYYISGTVAVIDTNLAVIDCGGVGYACSTTNYTLSQLTKGSSAKLYTYLHVKEDAMDLYGFASQSELNSQINYATVEIDLAGHIDADEREPVTGDTSGESMGERMKSGFASSVEWLRSFSTDALVLLVSSLPRLVVFIPALALVILLIVWIARKKHR